MLTPISSPPAHDVSVRPTIRPPLVGHLFGDPARETQIEQHLALRQHHQRHRQPHKVLCRRRERRPERHGRQPGRHRGALAEPIRQSSGERGEEAGQFGEGERHPHPAERHVEAARDQRDERVGVPVAGVAGDAGERERHEVAVHLGHVTVVEEARQHVDRR
ncbi:MAG: hypothetical protein R2713_16845 [Ilumatobacteraceae bacterium]